MINSRDEVTTVKIQPRGHIKKIYSSSNKRSSEWLKVFPACCSCSMVDLKFLKLLQHLEAKMKALLRTIHVKDGENVEQTVFNKIISNSVVKYAVNATKLLKSSHGMLISAAADLHILKCENLLGYKTEFS